MTPLVTGQVWRRELENDPDTFEVFVIRPGKRWHCIDAGGDWATSKGWTSDGKYDQRPGCENQFTLVGKRADPGNPAFAAGWKKWGGPK